MNHAPTELPMSRGWRDRCEGVMNHAPTELPMSHGWRDRCEGV